VVKTAIANVCAKARKKKSLNFRVISCKRELFRKKRFDLPGIAISE
jgi:hypothetical protein